VPPSFLRRDEQPAHVNQLLEVGHREMIDRCDDQRTSVVNEDVKMPESLDRRVDCPANFVGVGRVSLDG
jgi:hypothetical protein